MFYIFSLLYHIFLLISYRIKIYIQYHYVYYIYTLCLYLIYLHLIYLHLIYSHLIYSHLIYSHLIYLPFKFTSIIFLKIRRCAPHVETYQPPPTLTLGSTFHIQYRSIQTQVSKTPTLHNQALKKSPRGVQRGRGFAAPLRFSYFRQKILRPFANPNETQYFSKVFFYILLLHNTHPIHSLNLLEFI